MSAIAMIDVEQFDIASKGLARRGLIITFALAWAGGTVGILGSHMGTVGSSELILVYISILFSTASLITLFFFRNVQLQTLATAATVFYALNLSVGVMIVVWGSGNRMNIVVYLFWFFPLLVFNKLVNRPSVGRTLARYLVIGPVLLICALLPWIFLRTGPELLILVTVFCICYICFGLMLTVVTKYREEYIVEREHSKALRVEAEVLESLSDCYMSLDTADRLIYLNDAACIEFGIDRQSALHKPLRHVAPGFFSVEMGTGLQLAWESQSATTFEAQNRSQDLWYVMHCYPRVNGMSVHFRNITEVVASRRRLQMADKSLRDQAALLDKATDAIYVLDRELRFLYWNKGAEHLYGCPSDAVIGQLVNDVFQYENAESFERFSSILLQEEWAGEIIQRHSDGRTLVVESHCTLVKGEDESPQSILAIDTDVTERKAAEERIQQLAYYDSLTALPNRILLKERLEKALIKSHSEGTKGSVMFIDLDDFKTLNDTRGHDTGDQLLQQVAGRLASCVRDGDTVARLGGDEFVVMLEKLSGDAGVATTTTEVVGNAIIESLKRPYALSNHEALITCGIGITLFPEALDTTREVLKRADLAMYRAKVKGWNSMCFFDSTMQQSVAARAELTSDLRRAIGRQELELHYQPQVNRSGQVKSCEALLRWTHSMRGQVPPSEFIPLAEEAGLIFELGKWVLETACAQLAAWKAHPVLQELQIAVNVSTRQFLDVSFVEIVQKVVRETGANPHRLKIEITESVMVEHVGDIIAKMGRLKDFGIGLSLDDFGTGYSSLSYLRQLPLDQLKIDRSFVKNVVTDTKDAAITSTIIALGRNLDFAVIAEGVETEEQMSFLENEGCHLFQGYLYSPALNKASFEEFARKLCRKVGGD